MVTKVYVLWHVHHQAGDETGTVIHRSESNRVSICEEEGDNPKILGVHSTREHAEDRVGRARPLPGFRDGPNCFLIGGYELDTDEWSEGYQIVHPT
ncbi:hypothetical protein AB0J52_14690 [Spirillospora sp. NPDC049652]